MIFYFHTNATLRNQLMYWEIFMLVAVELAAYDICSIFGGITLPVCYVEVSRKKYNELRKCMFTCIDDIAIDKLLLNDYLVSFSDAR